MRSVRRMFGYLRKTRILSLLLILTFVIIGIGYAVSSYIGQNGSSGRLEYEVIQGFTSLFRVNEQQTMKLAVRNTGHSSFTAKISVFQIQGLAGFDTGDINSSWALYDSRGNLISDFGKIEFVEGGSGYIAYHGSDTSVPAGFDGYYLITLAFENTAPSGHYESWIYIYMGENGNWDYARNWDVV